MTGRISRALVTGASAGIGAEFARQLAARGVELVLVARREERLRRLADQLPVPAEVLPADLGDPRSLACVAARAGTVDEPVDLVVNAAGRGSYGAFAAHDHTRWGALVDVNVTALTQLTLAALPQLLRRGQGGIINVGSTAGYRPCPRAAVYGATKAYVRSFTEAVHAEVAGRGVHVMLLAPGSTATEFQGLAGVRSGPVATALRAAPEKVVADALGAFGARRTVCVPGAPSRIAAAGARMIPRSVARRLSSRATGKMMVP